MSLDLRTVKREDGVLTSKRLFQTFGLTADIPGNELLDDSLLVLEECLVKYKEQYRQIPFLIVNDIHLMHEIKGTATFVARLLHWAGEIFVLTVKYTTSHWSAANSMLSMSGHSRLSAKRFPPAHPVDIAYYLATYQHKGACFCVTGFFSQTNWHDLRECSMIHR